MSSDHSIDSHRLYWHLTLRIGAFKERWIWIAWKYGWRLCHQLDQSDHQLTQRDGGGHFKFLCRFSGSI